MPTQQHSVVRNGHMVLDANTPSLILSMVPYCSNIAKSGQWAFLLILNGFRPWLRDSNLP
jgi:hypothetical protein